MIKQATLQDITLLLTRLATAAIFIYAGVAKFFVWGGPVEGMPEAMVWLTKLLSIVEPLGAVALLAGYLTRWAGAGLTLIMFGSLFFVYFMFKAPFFTGQTGTGMDYNVLLMVTSLVLAVYGGGNWSVDALLARKK